MIIKVLGGLFVNYYRRVQIGVMPVEGLCTLKRWYLMFLARSLTGAR